VERLGRMMRAARPGWLLNARTFLGCRVEELREYKPEAP
jgi:hypothetical protein